jgi:hypothetical protein
MSLSFAAPMMLAALAAIVVPILLHLSRREETRIEMFAALRWLRAGARPTSRLRFDEWVLLAVRVLLVAAIAFWLAQPFWQGAIGRLLAVVAVVPGVAMADVDRLAPAADDVDRRWLAPGFPAIDALQPIPAKTASFSSLLRELDATLPASQGLTVIVPNEIDGVDAERPRLSREVGWQVAASPTRAPAQPAVTAPTRKLALRHDTDLARAARFVHAAVAAWNAQTPNAWTLDAAPVDAPIDQSIRQVIVLSAEVPRTALDVAARGGRVVHVPTAAKPDAIDVERRHGAGTVVELALPFDPATRPALLEPEFPSQLARWVEGAPPAPDRATAAMIEPVVGKPSAVAKPSRSLTEPLAWAILALLAIERWLATRRRRFMAVA